MLFKEIPHELGGIDAHGRLAGLDQIVEGWGFTLLTRGERLPHATANKEYSGKFIVRASPAVHRKTVLKAMARGDSLNQFVAQALAKA